MLVEKSFDTGEVILNYAEGPPSGPPLLLLHGSTGKWQGVASLVPYLAKHWHVYALDLRGHGKSGHVSRQYRLVDHTRDVVAFLTHLSEPAVLIGHSLGATIALAVSAASPSLTRAAVLLDPPIYKGEFSIDGIPWAREAFGWVYDTIQGSPSLETILARCHAQDPKKEENAEAAYADQLFHLDPDTIRIVLDGQVFDGFDLAQALDQVRSPVLLIYGDLAHGAAMGEEAAAFVQSRLPTVITLKIPDGDHMFFENQQASVLKQLDAFLPVT